MNPLELHNHLKVMIPSMLHATFPYAGEGGKRIKVGNGYVVSPRLWPTVRRINLLIFGDPFNPSGMGIIAALRELKSACEKHGIEVKR